jgi:hypothetical protein
MRSILDPFHTMIRHSVQILENGKIHIEPTHVAVTHGPKGKILLPCVTPEVAKQIQEENVIQVERPAD